MLCAYAILRARDPRPLDVTGLDGAPITARAAGRIAVVCSVHAGERLPRRMRRTYWHTSAWSKR
jgi:hypothetical protein